MDPVLIGMSKTSLFNLGPERLNRLLSIGKEKLDPGDDPNAEPAGLISQADNLTEKPGSWIGRYKLIRMLGEGGMGVVYLAEQEHPIKRHVALKIIKLGMDTKRVIVRFEAERQALALLDHATIQTVELDREPNKDCYLSERMCLQRPYPLRTDEYDRHKRRGQKMRSFIYSTLRRSTSA